MIKYRLLYTIYIQDRPPKQFIKNLLTHDMLKNILLQLPEEQFVKVHKSFIISFEKINFVEGNDINIHDNLIPIGSAYRQQVMVKIVNRKL